MKAQVVNIPNPQAVNNVTVVDKYRVGGASSDGNGGINIWYSDDGSGASVAVDVYCVGAGEDIPNGGAPGVNCSGLGVVDDKLVLVRIA